VTAANACPRGLCDGSGILDAHPSTLAHDAGVDLACECAAALAPVDSPLGLPIEGVPVPDAWELASSAEDAAEVEYDRAECEAKEAMAAWSAAGRARRALGPRPAKE
jgi:hypothetical protein